MTVIHRHQSLTLKLHLFLERNNKADVQDSAFENIEKGVLSKFDANYKNLGERQYLLTTNYTDNDNLDENVEELLTSIEEKAGRRDCNIADTYIHVENDESRQWK